MNTENNEADKRPNNSGRFQPGNKLSANGAGNRSKNPLTRVLISYLNEAKKNGGKGRMYELVEKLFTIATTGDGDLEAIKYLFDRVDGKLLQPLAMQDENGDPYEFSMKLGYRGADGAESVAEVRLQPSLAVSEAGDGVLLSEGLDGSDGPLQPN